MRRVFNLMGNIIFAVILGIFVFLPYGCSTSQLGETAAEGNRRHKRVMRIQQKELMADIDMFLLLDQPPFVLPLDDELASLPDYLP